MTMSRGCVLLSLLILTASCAKLDYVKVPTASQYEKWNDEKQREADTMKGVRYYLPRPFVHLKQSVPVAQRMALVSFAYDSNTKRYKAQFPQNAPEWLKRVTPLEISITQALAAILARGSQQEEGARQQAGETGDGAAETTPSRQEPPPSTISAKTGYINDSDPITHLSDILDVVYLPDFDEQYAIQVKSGLGKADIETRLRNGWAAEVFSQKVDNSNLVPYVIRQVEHASDAAAKIASTWWPVITGVGAPAVALTSKLAKMGEGAQLQAGETGDSIDPKSFLGELIVFKVAEIRVAQPGLYPILKPREMRGLVNSQSRIAGKDQDEVLDLVIQNSLTPWIRPDVAFIPSPPFTVVGFNTTTEVFIAAATDRIATQVVGERVSRPVQNQELQGHLEKVKRLLSSNVSSGGKEAISTLQPANISVEKGDRVGTKIKLTNPAHPFSAGEKPHYVNWIKQVFTLSDDEARRLDLAITGNGNTLTIIVPDLTPAQLGARAQ